MQLGTRWHAGTHCVGCHARSRQSHTVPLQVDYHKGGGSSRLVFPDSIAINRLAPLSAGISNVGAGPMAVASAGEAVTMSMADLPDNPFNPSGGLVN